MHRLSGWVLLLLCGIAASEAVSHDVASLSPDDMQSIQETEDTLTADRDKHQAQLSADEQKLRQTQKALREKNSQHRSDELEQRRIADRISRLNSKKGDEKSHLDELKAEAKRLESFADRKEAAVNAATASQHKIKKQMAAAKRQLESKDEVVERAKTALDHKHSNVDESRGNVQRSREKVRALRTAMGLATGHLDAAAKAMADAEASDKQARLDLNKRAEKLKLERLAEAKMEAALKAAEQKATEEQQAIDQTLLLQRADAAALRDTMAAAAAAGKAAAAQGKTAESSKRIAETLQESVGLADGEQLTVGKLGEHIKLELEKIEGLRENVTALQMDLRITQREKTMVEKEQQASAAHEESQVGKHKNDDQSLNATRAKADSLSTALDKAQLDADAAARTQRSTQMKLQQAQEKQSLATAKRKQAERTIHSDVQANIPPGASIDRAQQMLRLAQKRIVKARGKLHNAIEAEHNTMDTTKEDTQLSQEAQALSAKLGQERTSLQLQLDSAKSRIRSLGGKLEGDETADGEAHDETELMHKRVDKVSYEAAAVASRLQQTQDELAMAEQRLLQMQTKQKELSMKIQAELKHAEPAKMFGPVAQAVQNTLELDLSPEKQQEMKDMIQQATNASATNAQLQAQAKKSAADEIAAEQAKIKTPADLKKFKAELKAEQEENQAKRAAQEEERQQKAALEAENTKNEVELVKAKQAQLEADAEDQAAEAAKAAQKAAKTERENVAAVQLENALNQP